MESFTILRDENGAVVGYTFTYTYDDGAGYNSTTTSTYDANGDQTASTFSDTNGNSGSNSRVTNADGSYVESGTSTNSWTDANNTTITNTSSYVNNYDASGSFTGGTSTWNGETTTYGANWTILSQTTSTAGLQTVAANSMAADLFGVDALYKTDANGNTTYYDAATGAKLGSSNTNTNTWTDWNTNASVTSTNTGYNDANWGWLGSEWSDSNGSSGSNSRVTNADGSYVESGTSTNTWVDANNTTITNTSSYVNNYDASGSFTGGTSTWNGETTTYGANWTILSQTTDTTGMTALTAADGMAFELFGAALVKTNTFTDWNGNPVTETTYYDAATGAKLGSSNTNTNTWTDVNTNTQVTSTNTGYNDANWGWLGSTWSDSNGNSGSNSRVTNVVDGSYVESGTSTNTWVDANSTTITNTSSYVNNYDASGSFTGGTSTWNGETTTYGANWTILSQTTDTTGMTALTAADGMAFELFGAALVKTNTFTDWNGNPVTETTYYDA